MGHFGFLVKQVFFFSFTIKATNFVLHTCTVQHFEGNHPDFNLYFIQGTYWTLQAIISWYEEREPSYDILSRLFQPCTTTFSELGLVEQECHILKWWPRTPKIAKHCAFSERAPRKENQVLLLYKKLFNTKKRDKNGSSLSANNSMFLKVVSKPLSEYQNSPF